MPENAMLRSLFLSSSMALERTPMDNTPIGLRAEGMESLARALGIPWDVWTVRGLDIIVNGTTLRDENGEETVRTAGWAAYNIREAKLRSG